MNDKQEQPVSMEPWSYAGAMPPEQEEVKKAAYQLAPWLSAALDDPNVCKEYKDAINAWFDAAMPAAPETVSMEPNQEKWTRRYQEVLDQNNDLKQRIAELEKSNTQLLEALKQIEVTSPDGDEIVWINLHGHGITGKAILRVGKQGLIAAQVARLFEEDRRAAIAAAEVKP